MTKLPLETSSGVSLTSAPESGTIEATTKATPRRANVRGHGTEGKTSMQAGSYAHTGNPVEDLEVRCVGPSREYGRKRTTHYGVCRCGWQTIRRTTAERVVSDYRRHLREVNE